VNVRFWLLGNYPKTWFDKLTTNGGEALCPFVLSTGTPLRGDPKGTNCDEIRQFVGSLSKDRPFQVVQF
jgi:hypothetical protein